MKLPMCSIEIYFDVMIYINSLNSEEDFAYKKDCPSRRTVR